MEKQFSNGAAGTFYSQIINIGDDIDLNRFMSHLNDLCLYKYPNLSKNLLYLSIIVPTVVLIVTAMRIVICVESMHIFQCKWDS